MEDQVSIFMSPSDRMAQLYPQAPGSLFVSFYDSQAHGGVILTSLQTGKFLAYFPYIEKKIKEYYEVTWIPVCPSPPNVPRQRLCNHLPVATNSLATIE
jgi:hypothetical protein